MKPTLRILLFGVLLLASVVPAQAQGTLIPFAPQTFVDANGNPLSGGKLCTYAAGTTTPQATYSSNVLTVPNLNSNPVIMAANGRPTSGAIFLSPTSYKFVFRQPGTTTDCTTGTILWTLDNITAIPTTSGAVDVTGTAGETITAGQATYLSDGSGSTNPGQWYKADSANPYSSTVPEVGMAPATIASGATGTIRLVGEITGLSGLVAGGVPYYIGTAGAITTTAPANARVVGQADSTTSMVIGQIPVAQDNGVNDFRLTLTTGVPVTTADVTAATSVFLAPFRGDRIALYSSTGVPFLLHSGQVSIAVPNAANQMYDVFAFASSGVLTLELVAWTNDTARATAIVSNVATGIYTKSGDATRRYLGSFRTTTVAGQTEDSLTKRYLFNYYQRMPRILRRLESTGTWTYTTLTVRQANGSASNQVEVVIGVAEIALKLALRAASFNSNADITRSVGIGEDSTTTYMAQALNTGIQNGAGTIAINAVINHTVDLTHYPAIGRHVYSWNEDSAATGTTTWIGTTAATGGSNSSQSGLTGEVVQ